MCLLNRLVTIIPLCFCLEKEGLTDRQRRREGRGKKANHLRVCQVKGALTRGKEIRVIRSGGKVYRGQGCDKRGEEKKEREREKVGGNDRGADDRSWEGKGG